jgi:DNA-directed RNA polymerase subunit RPC12/RpoP
MINFSCPRCGKGLEAKDNQAGTQVRCTACGVETLVPIDVLCEEGPIAPDAKTITLDELEAIKKGLRGKPQG